jgi:hypothetical protein
LIEVFILAFRESVVEWGPEAESLVSRLHSRRKVWGSVEDCHVKEVAVYFLGV